MTMLLDALTLVLCMTHAFFVLWSGQVTVGILGSLGLLGDYRVAEREEDTAQVL